MERQKACNSRSSIMMLEAVYLNCTKSNERLESKYWTPFTRFVLKRFFIISPSQAVHLPGILLSSWINRAHEYPSRVEGAQYMTISTSW